MNTASSIALVALSFLCASFAPPPKRVAPVRAEAARRPVRPAAQESARDKALSEAADTKARAAAALTAARARRAVVTLTDGSTLNGMVPADATIVLDTLLGPLSIPLSSLASLTVEPPATTDLRPATPKPIFHCSFDSPTAVRRPAVGPAGVYLEGDFVPGKVGNALRVPVRRPVAQFDFPKGFLGPKGTIEFWAKILERSPGESHGGGGFPRFLCMWLDGSAGNPRNTYFQITGNDGLGHAGLCAMASGAAVAASTDAVDADPTGWHHYAMVWDASGLGGAERNEGKIPTVAVYVDGVRQAVVGNASVDRAERTLGRFSQFPILLGFPLRLHEGDPAGNHVPFLIDEFKIWDLPRQAADLR